MSFNGSGPTTAATVGGARKMDLLGSEITSEDKAPTNRAQRRPPLTRQQKAELAKAQRKAERDVERRLWGRGRQAIETAKREARAHAKIQTEEQWAREETERADWVTRGLPPHITRLRAPPTDPPTREQVLNGVEGALRKLDRLPSAIGDRKEIGAAKEALAVVIEFLTGAVS